MTASVLDQQLTFRGMPRRRRFCPARDCHHPCALGECLCWPCSCPACSRRAERAGGNAQVSAAARTTIDLSIPHIYLQSALFRQRPERSLT